jgi:hypothetical protein
MSSKSHLQSYTVNIGVVWVCLGFEYTVENLAEKRARSKPYVFILESIKLHLHCTAYLCTA